MIITTNQDVLQELLKNIAKTTLKQTIQTKGCEQAFYLGVTYICSILELQLEEDNIKIPLSYSIAKNAFEETLAESKCKSPKFNLKQKK